MQPLMPWRMATPPRRPAVVARLASLPQGFLDKVLDMVAEHGPISAPDAQRELIRLAARANGIASEPDLRNHWIISRDQARPASPSLSSPANSSP